MSDEAKPYSKAQQLARGERRYRRKVASPKQWQAIISAKHGRCRVCERGGMLAVYMHHLIPRDFHGDDVPDNVIPLCELCHGRVTMLRADTVHTMLRSLSDAEYAYAVGKAGEDWAERIYGLRYSRV